MKGLKFGVNIKNRTPWIPLSIEIQEQAKLIEGLGFHSLWFSDPIALRSPRFETWTLLSRLASITDRIRLAPLILPRSFQHPEILARMAASLDTASNGRLEFGIRIWRNEPEYASHRMDIEKHQEIMDILEESLGIICWLWTKETLTYNGKYFKISDAFCTPKPIQKPYPPITIGDTRDYFTMKLAVQFANRLFLTGSIETCQQQLIELAERYSGARRKFQNVEKSLFTYIQVERSEEDLKMRLKEFHDSLRISLPFKDWYEQGRHEFMISGNPDECVDRIREYGNIGIDFVILRFFRIPSVKVIKLIKDQIVDCV